MSGEVEPRSSGVAASRARPGVEDETAVLSPDFRRDETAEPSVGGSVGRYVVLGEIGRGGMGRVLRAYDPKLQREVALKEVHRAALDDDGATRLVAEARAMATLSHPNVVAVFDVEERDEVVLVMEYVPGETLQAWLRSGPRPWTDVVRHFVAAGRGLATAHAAGLLHRDFKPSNVLVAAGDVVKVTDFGLAKRSGSGEAADEHARADSVETGRGAHSGSRTETGIVLGTPRYMAPEQHDGERLSATADQYAFCVALFEALCGRAPFSGADLGRRKRDGPPPWPAGTAVPRPIVSAIVRGLAGDPNDRWPSMDALLEALAYDPARRRAKWLTTIAGASALALGGVAWHGWATRLVEQCAGAQEQLAGVWDDARRAGVHAAVTGIDQPYAAPVWDRIAHDLDVYAATWTEAHTDACEATTIRGEQSIAVMDARMGCLHRAKLELRAVTAVLADADPEVVIRAQEVLGGLRPLERCADIEALQAEVEPPLPEDADAVEAARAHVADAAAARAAGRFDEAQTEMEAAQASVTDVDYGPVRTEIAVERGEVLQAAGDHPGAQAAFEHALELGGEHRQWAQMADAAVALVFVIGDLERRFDEGLRYVPVARGLVAGDPEREATLHNSLGNLRQAQGKFEDALTEYQQAIALWEEALGPDDRNVARARNNLGGALLAKGDYAGAEAELRRATALFERNLGPVHPQIASSHNNLAGVLLSQGKYDEAEAEIRIALGIRKQALGPDHPDVAGGHNNLGAVLHELGRDAEAETELRRALVLGEKARGPEHPAVAATRYLLGKVLEAQGKYEAAEAEHRHALSQLEKTLDPEHPELATARTYLAQVLLVQGDAAAALPLAEQAWSRRSQPDIAPEYGAEAAFVLARALWATGGPADRLRARALADRALDAYEQTGLDVATPRIVEIRAWLDRHRGR